MSLSERFKIWRKRRRLLKMSVAASIEAEQAYLLGDYEYGDALFKRAEQLAAGYDAQVERLKSDA